MNIGILGAGRIGGTLGRELAARGHTVVLGVRNPESTEREAGDVAQFGTLEEAAQFGEILVLAVPFGAARDTLAAAGDISDKIILDTTNDFGGLLTNHPSAAAAIAEWSGSARVVKVFNTHPYESLANPIYSGVPLDSFVAGDDAEAKAVAMQLAGDLGFEPIDVGGLDKAVLLEGLAKLWGTLAFGGGGARRETAFKLLARG